MVKYLDAYKRAFFLEYELKYDIYMGRHARSPEEDTEMSEVISKHGMLSCDQTITPKEPYKLPNTELTKIRCL
ncbi:uncharacterized protein PG986_010729 [Apiospora aurea]|uniref:Uncharacterized protein n=1 Tax=Apiospora aurea TaxID=335848 RepID=A0ABR1Q336_9PEZI